MLRQEHGQERPRGHLPLLLQPLPLFSRPKPGSCAGHRNQWCVSLWPPEGRSFSWIFWMNLGWGEWTIPCPHLFLSFPLTSLCAPSSTSSSMTGSLTGARMGHGEVPRSTVGGTGSLRKYSIHSLIASVQLPISLGDLAKGSAQDGS